LPKNLKWKPFKVLSIGIFLLISNSIKICLKIIIFLDKKDLTGIINTQKK